MKITFKYIKSLWPLVSKEELFKIIISFLFLGLLGVFVTSQFQEKSWERQVRYELLKNELETNRQVVIDITSMINQRLFATQQIVWALQDRQSNINDLWQSYISVVDKWNNNLSFFQTKLAEIFGYEIAEQFLTHTDDLNNDIPVSIHYKFYRIHQNLSSLKNCNYLGCGSQKKLIELEELIRALIEQQSRFLPKLNESLNEKYDLLKSSPSLYLKEQSNT